MRHPFRYFNSSPKIIRLAVTMYVRFPPSLRQVEDLLHEQGIDICHENGAVLVKSVRSDVRRGDQEEAIGCSARLAAVALASRRSLREDQW